MCNRVGIIDKGELRAEGRVADLLAGMGPATQVELGVGDRRAATDVIATIEGAALSGSGEDDRLLVTLRGIDAAALNTALVKAGVAVHALVPRTGNLEDLFLSVTSNEPGVGA